MKSRSRAERRRVEAGRLKRQRLFVELLEPRLLLSGIQGVKWHDLNANQVRDAGEPGLAGWTIFLDANGDGSLNEGESSAVTRLDDPSTTDVDETGQYTFAGLSAAEYKVCEVVPAAARPEWRTIYPAGGSHTINLEADETRTGVDFGNQQLSEIRGMVWEDVDGNKQLGGGERGLANWTVFLDANANERLDQGEKSTSTDTLGNFAFENLDPGSYQVAEVIQDRWVQTAPGGSRIYSVSVAAGQILEDVDFGNRPAEIFGKVFDDVDRNGTQGTGEAGLRNWVVKLDLASNGSIDVTAATDGEGKYGFTDVPAGTHKVSVELQDPYHQSFPLPPGTHTVQMVAGVQQEDPFSFGVFYPPDLAPGIGAFGFYRRMDGGDESQQEVRYAVGLNGQGILGPQDRWTEEVWLVDDGALDGQGFELKMNTTEYTAVGNRTTLVTPPVVAAESSTVGQGAVTVAMIRSGLELVAKINATGQTIERDLTNNTTVRLATWLLPDLAVSATQGTTIGLDLVTNDLIFPDAVKYTVKNQGSVGIQAGVQWVEQLWLGTDENVLAGSDPARGIFHMKIAAGSQIPGTQGPLARNATVERTIPISVDRLPLPKGIDPTGLKWFILLDRPEGSTVEEANPGAVFESHEQTLGAPTNNIYTARAFPANRMVDVDSNGVQDTQRVTQWMPSVASISYNGRYVAYVANYDLVDDPVNEDYPSVYIHDRDADQDGIFDERDDPGALKTILVSKGFDGSAADNRPATDTVMLSRSPDPAFDGRFVTFCGWANNLVANDTNHNTDVFVYDRDSDGNGVFDEPAGTEMSIASVDSAGRQYTSGGLSAASITPDGRYVAFFGAVNIQLADDETGPHGVYVRDRLTGRTRNVAVNDVNDPVGVQRRWYRDPKTNEIRYEYDVDGGVGIGYPAPAISGDGRLVAFSTDYRNLVVGAKPGGTEQQNLFAPWAGDQNGRFDVFLHDRDANENGVFDERPPRGFILQKGHDFEVDPKIRTTRISTSSSGSELPGDGYVTRPDAFSTDGNRLVFVRNGKYYLGGAGPAELVAMDLETGTVRVLASQSGSTNHPARASISPDGRFVGIQTEVALAPGDTNGRGDVYLYDWQTGVVTRMSVGQDGEEPNYWDRPEGSRQPSVSAGGHWVAFASFGYNLVAGDRTRYGEDIFVRYNYVAETGEIRGVVFEDLDADGQRDSGEPGKSDWLVRLDLNNDGTVDRVVRSEADGMYFFGQIAPGTHKVTIEQVSPVVETAPGTAAAPGYYTIEVLKDGSVGRVLRQDGQAVARPDFGLFPPPDLRVDEPAHVVPANQGDPAGALFGAAASVSYTVGEAGPGVLRSTDSWKEKLYLTDDGKVDGSGFELMLGEATFTGPDGVGTRTMAVTMPSLGASASTIGTGVVTVAMVKQGLKFTVQLDTDPSGQPGVEGSILESDETNNQASKTVDWRLPDLRVTTLDPPDLVFNAQLNEMTYTVANAGDAPVGAVVLAGQPVQWVEQLWLGTDSNVTAANNPAGGVWHHLVNIQTITGAMGPLNPGSEVQRRLTPDLTGVQLPAEINAAELRWVVLLDWPSGVGAEGADPAAILETHEVEPTNPPPTDPLNAFAFYAARIDLSPLQIELASGEFQYNGRQNRFEGSGTIQIGLKPPQGGNFAPLLIVDGQVYFNEEVIHAEGRVSATVGGLPGAIFSGTFEIPVGQAKTSSIASPLDVFAIVTGVEVNLTQIELAVPEGGTPADARVEIQGSLALPDDLGGVSLSVTDPHKIVLDRNGLGITGGAIAFPDVEFKLMSLEAKAEELSVEYLTDPKKAFRIRGRLSLPEIYNVTADFAGEENYIEISADGVEVIGTLSAEEIVFVPDVWELKNIVLSFNTVDDEFRGDAELTIPTGITIVAGIGFREGDLNYLQLGVDDLNKPIPPTPVFLQRIVGRVDHIAESDEEPVAFGGELGLTAGPEVTIPLPDWAGGNVSGAVAELSVSGDIDANHLTASGELKIAGGLISGSAKAEVNWEKGFLAAEGNLQSLGGIITVDASFKADSNLNVTLSGAATVSLPEDFPVIGGEPLASGHGYFQYRNDAISSNDFVAGWGTINVPIIGQITAGLRVRFDGDIDFLGADEVEGISGGALSVIVAAGAPLGLFGAGAETFTVPANVPWFLFSAEWENASPGTKVELRKPDGTWLNEADIEADPNMAIVEELTSPTKRTVIVKSPAAGDWTFDVADATGLGQVELTGLAGNAAPTVALTGLTQDVTNQSSPTVAIGYTAQDTDSAARVWLYYDADREGFDGVPIALDLPEQGGPGNFNWNTAGVPTGDYYVYAMIQDDVNPPVFSQYSLGRVRLVQTGAPLAVAGLQTRLGGPDAVRLSWEPATGAGFYRISYTADAAGEFYTNTLATDGPVTQAIVGGLTPGETYRFIVQAVDGTGRIGAASEPAVGVAGPLATVQPGAGEWNVFADPGTTYTATVPRSTGDTLTLVGGPEGCTLDAGTGLLQWTVPFYQEDGWHEVVVHRTDATGQTEVLRRYLLIDAQRAGEITGRSALDADGDGLEDAGEPGLANRTVFLDLDRDGQLDANEPSTTTNAAGDYGFAGLTPGDYLAAERLPTGWTQTYPASSAAREIALDGGDAAVLDFGSRPQSGFIRGTVWDDVDQDRVRDEGEPVLAARTVYADLNGNRAPDEAAVTFSAAGVPLPLADDGTVVSTLTVSGLLGIASDVDVAIDVSHPYDGDLELYLVSPSGTRVPLFYDVGGSGDDFTGTTLDDEATLTITEGTAPFTGRYQPQFALGVLDGEDPNGVWTLEVTDDSQQAVGVLNAWSLSITVAEPSAVSDSEGAYQLSGLWPGSYGLRQVVPRGWMSTLPVPAHQIDLTPGETEAGVNFGSSLATQDFGDAPDPLSATPGQYPTLLVNNGPRHSLGSDLYLGASVDGEPDGQPTDDAHGDDLDADGDDDDGVALPAALIARLGARATVTASAPGKLDAWIDFNRNGIFEAGEQIAATLPLVTGANAVDFAVPAGASAGQTFARFRVSTAGGLGPVGLADDGEVEDYQVQVVTRPERSAAVLDDPEYPGQPMLLIMGTANADAISFSVGAKVRVRLGSAGLGDFLAGSFRRIAVFGLDGGDTLAFASGTFSSLGGGLFFDGGDGPKPDTLSLVGTSGSDTFVLGGDDVLINGLRAEFRGAETVKLDGTKGNDTYQIPTLDANFTISDSAGADTLDFSAATTAVKINLAKAAGQLQSIFAGGPGTLALRATIEKVQGTALADEIYGNSIANRIDGGGGDDRLYGSSGNDSLYGDDGNDTLYGGPGNDWLYGGDGDDWLYGDAGNDKLFGDAGHNVLLGGAGNDTLEVSVNAAATDRNLLIGGLGVDTLTGGAGEEILIGGTTTYDNKLAALAAVMGEWKSGNSFDARWTRLDAGYTDDPLVGFIQLKRKTKTSGTVIDDKVRDQLFGGQGSDWLLNFNKDETQ